MPDASVVEYLFLDGDHNYLWFFVMGVLVYVGVAFLRVARESKARELTSAYQLNLGFAIFFFFYTVTRACFYVSTYYSVYGSESDLGFQIPIRAGYCFSLFALAFLFYGLEKHVLPTKGVLALVPAVMGGLCTFLPYDLMRNLTYVTQGICGLFILGMFLYMAKISTGELRTNALVRALGLLTFVGAIFLDSKSAKLLFTDVGLRWVVFLLAPPIAIVGLMLCYWTIKRSES